MIRNQRGTAVVGLLAVLALALFSGGVYYYLQNKSYAPATSDLPATRISTPKEIKNDSDASQLEASMNEASDTNLNDAKPSSGDLGI